MYKGLPILFLLFAVNAVAGGDIWESLFREKLQEASLGNSDAQYDVGAMYQNGRGVTADRYQAMAWYRKAAAQGHPAAISRLDLMQANEERFDSEKKRAENGDTESQYELGNMYAKGIGTPIDHEQSRQWYQKAASQGHIKAGYKLGLIFHEGSGVRKNSKTALGWFRQAAEKGYAPAQYYLGKLYATGDGVGKNYHTALEWFTQAVDGGFTEARDEMNDISEKLKGRNKSSTSPGESTRTGKSAAGGRENSAQQPATDGVTLQDLMHTAWSRDEEPVAYLPSAINDCEIENQRMLCNTAERVRENAGNNIRYRTRAIIRDFSKDGSFRIVYRNLVISSTPIGRNAATQGETEAGYAIKSGWGKQHTLECVLKDDTTISCLKDGAYAFDLSNQQKLAAGR
ncbi:MAG: tetratricopeptide repeat protein [Gammaproteobacteria bacterium]|jgi:hypothetical protein